MQGADRTCTSGAVWGSVSSLRTLQHADQGNRTSNLPLTSSLQVFFLVKLAVVEAVTESAGIGSCPCLTIREKTRPPLHAVLCPWKWAGIPENCFALLLYEQGEERHGILTNYFNSDYCWIIELFYTYCHETIMRTGTLTFNPVALQAILQCRLWLQGQRGDQRQEGI